MSAPKNLPKNPFRRSAGSRIALAIVAGAGVLCCGLAKLSAAELLTDSGNGALRTDAPGTLGYDFMLKSDETLTGLGIYAPSGMLANSHAVGLFDVINNNLGTATLLANVTVGPSTGPADTAGFIYGIGYTADNGFDGTLLANHDYVLGAYYAPPAPYTDAFVNGFNSGDTFSGDVVSGSVHAAYSANTSGLSYPIYSGSGAYIGPNLTYTSVVPTPEPATLGVLGCGVLGVLLRRRRKA